MAPLPTVADSRFDAVLWSAVPSEGRHYVASSWLFARALGVVLAIAFASLGAQAMGLYGSTGVTPIAVLVESAKSAGHHAAQHPTVFWWSSSDVAITVCWVGGRVSAIAVASGFVPKLTLLTCWMTYLSFVSVGWPFMSFQWDTLLLETTFTAVFFVPWRLFDRLRGHRAPNLLARWALWWLLFRLVFRSAWVKLASADPTWADLSALTFHYWTQPLPTVAGWYASHLPEWIHRVSCLAMFLIELGAPLLIAIPRAWSRRTAAVSISFLMVLIAITGNYGFFNLLTIVLCVPLLDDRLLRRLAARIGDRPQTDRETRLDTAAAVGPALLIVITSVLFFTGTFGTRPPRWLGPVYPFATLNNYGLFAVMTTERREIVIEGTADGETWRPYVFAYKPGPVDRAPVTVAPHQPRLDWQMWFAALGDFRKNTWLAHLMKRLVEGEPFVLRLLGENPFEQSPPTQVRAIIYRYRPATLEELEEDGSWWVRDERMLYAPVLGSSP